LGVQPRDDLSAERFFAAEEMCAASDVEKQSFRRIERDDWREAFAPGGDVIERAGVFFRFSFYRFELWLHGARIGERHGEA